MYTLITICAVVVGIEAASPSLHPAEDPGTHTGLPGCYDHYDLHAAEGNTHSHNTVIIVQA